MSKKDRRKIRAGEHQSPQSHERIPTTETDRQRLQRLSEEDTKRLLSPEGLPADPLRIGHANGLSRQDRLRSTLPGVLNTDNFSTPGPGHRWLFGTRQATFDGIRAALDLPPVEVTTLPMDEVLFATGSAIRAADELRGTLEFDAHNPFRGTQRGLGNCHFIPDLYRLGEWLHSHPVLRTFVLPRQAHLQICLPRAPYFVTLSLLGVRVLEGAFGGLTHGARGYLIVRDPTLQDVRFIPFHTLIFTDMPDRAEVSMEVYPDIITGAYEVQAPAPGAWPLLVRSAPDAPAEAAFGNSFRIRRLPLMGGVAGEMIRQLYETDDTGLLATSTGYPNRIADVPPQFFRAFDEPIPYPDEI